MRFWGGRLLFAASLLFGGTAAAVEDYAATDFTPEGWGNFLSELARSIDVIGFALIIVFIILVAMCLDLFLHLRIGKLIPEGLLNDVQEEMSNGEYEKALDLCQKSEGMMGLIFAAALAKTDYSFDRMEEAMRGEVEIQGLVWRQWVGQFRIMAIVGLLLGLGGLLIESMRFIADLAGRPNIGLALASSFEMRAPAYCGMFCLLVGVATAVASLVAYTVASSKLEKILLEAKRLGEELLDPFRPLPMSLEE
jgi:hypothetical protein